MKTWIFQGNTKTFDIDGYLAACTGFLKWRVSQYPNDIHIGDTVYLWRSDSGVPDSGGILAECRVASEVAFLPDDENSLIFWKIPQTASVESRVLLKLIRLANKKEFIKRSWLKNDGVLSNMQILRQPAGTNFPVTTQQSHRLSKIWQRTGVDWSRSEVIAALKLYSELWNQPISKNIDSPIEKISQVIGRVPTGVYNKLMNFRSLDPRVEAAGLSGGSKIDRSVWDEFFDSSLKNFRTDLLNFENHRLWGQNSTADDLPQINLESEAARLENTSIDQLIKTYQSRVASNKPTRRSITNFVFDRDPLVVAIARKRANYTCEIPNCKSEPITLSNDEKYIEVHHVLPLAMGGEDTIENVACLCPNHHREIHFGKHSEELKISLRKIRS